MSDLNYKVQWVGVREGYGVTETTDEPNDYDVFRLFRDAKSSAVEKAKDDVHGARRGLEATRSLRKGDV